MAAAAPHKSMLDLLNGFVAELRNAGLPVSLTENLDAMEAVQHIPIEDREAFKYALGATLIKNNSHWRAFETVFEVYFSLRGAQWSLDPDAVDLLDLDEAAQIQALQAGYVNFYADDAVTPYVALAARGPRNECHSPVQGSAICRHRCSFREAADKANSRTGTCSSNPV